jgi:hypothetical protein
MQYLLLIYTDPTKAPAMGSPESNARMPQWNAYTEALRESGAFLAGDALHPVSAATTVRKDGIVTDGPFAETKEALGGYYAIDVPDLDAAIAWASKMPNLDFGSVEIRPVFDFAAAAVDAVPQGAAAE